MFLAFFVAKIFFFVDLVVAVGQDDRMINNNFGLCVKYRTQISKHVVIRAVKIECILCLPNNLKKQPHDFYYVEVLSANYFGARCVFTVHTSHKPKRTTH